MAHELSSIFIIFICQILVNIIFYAEDVFLPLFHSPAGAGPAGADYGSIAALSSLCIFNCP